MSVSRTVEDKQNNTGKIFIAKNRNGPDGMIYNIFMDTSNVKIKVLPKSNTIVPVSTNQQLHVASNPVSLTQKEQREVLQDKYAKFRKSKRKIKQ